MKRLSPPARVVEVLGLPWRLLHRLGEGAPRGAVILLGGALVGGLSGCVAAALRGSVELLELWRTTSDVGLWHVSGVPLPLPSALVAAAMAAAAILMAARWAPEAAGSGVQEIEGALDGVRPTRWWRVIPVKLVGGALALSSGLLLGREGPTVQLGGNVGAMVARWAPARFDAQHTLVAAGAGAGLAAAFNAPLAGILFVLEEMRPHFRYSVASVQVLAIACATADIVVRAVVADRPTLPLPVVGPPALEQLWVFALLGLVVGAAGAGFSRALLHTLDRLDGWPLPARVALGACAAACLVLGAGWLPDAVGGGERMVLDVLETRPALGALFALFAVRFVASLLSYGSGAPGGIFAPMLALGTLLGLLAGHGLSWALPGLHIHPVLLALAGMGALFSGVVRAPVTGLAIAVEMTGNFEQILPLILTNVFATLGAQGLGAQPIYAVLLRRTLSKEHAPPS